MRIIDEVVSCVLANHHKAVAIGCFEDVDDASIDDVRQSIAVLGAFPRIRSIRAKGMMTSSGRIAVGPQPGPTADAQGTIVDLRHTAAPVGIGGQEGRPGLPALPESIEMLEALIERSGVHRELGERNGRRQRDVRERPLIASQQPLAAVGEMPVDETSMRQCHLAGMLAPGGVAGQFELRAQTLVQDMEGVTDDRRRGCAPTPVCPTSDQAALVRSSRP